MLEPSSVDLNAGATVADIAPSQLRWSQRLLMIVLNYIPLIHVATVVWLSVAPAWPWPQRIAAAVAALYLAPPLAARFVLLLMPIAEGRITLGTRAFFCWWTLLQLQAVFCRLNFLDELLRLVPSLYSWWLRMWGSRIGRLTFWSSGVTVLDRSFLDIGDDVVLGAGVRLNPHVLARNAHGELELLLGTIRVGLGATVGGYSLLTAGTVVEAGETTRAYLISPPFSHWRKGRRVKQ